MRIKLTELAFKAFDVVACEGHTDSQVLARLQAGTARLLYDPDTLASGVYRIDHKPGDNPQKIADLKWCKFAHPDLNLHQYKKQSVLYEEFNPIQSDWAVVTDPA